MKITCLRLNAPEMHPFGKVYDILKLFEGIVIEIEFIIECFVAYVNNV